MSQIPSHSAAGADAQSASFVTAELSLGSRLNQSIHAGKRADFSYLLALLSDNVTESSAFSLTPPVATPPSWQPEFGVAPSVPLQCHPDEYQRSPTATFTRSRTLWQLQQALQPAGLHPVNDPQHIPAQVLGNCAHYVQQRFAPNQPKVWEAEPAELIDVLDQLRDPQLRNTQGVESAVA